jgi:ubiquinone/menaquinone biosynthesis C-methylase UbiE
MIEKYIKPNDRVIEAGCGSGRISNRISEMIDVKIDAFDFISKFIENAKKNQKNDINFFVADASDLNMVNDDIYDCAIYLQNLVSLVPTDKIDAVLRESHRILKSGGVLLLTILNYDGRSINKPLSRILHVLRKIRGESLTYQELPWMHLQRKRNWKFLCKTQATSYWFREGEIKTRLERAGFEIVEEFSLNPNRPNIHSAYVVRKV